LEFFLHGKPILGVNQIGSKEITFGEFQPLFGVRIKIFLFCWVFQKRKHHGRLAVVFRKKDGSSGSGEGLLHISDQTGRSAPVVPGW
jgi:hypothetical protein